MSVNTAVDLDLEQYRVALTGFCYRMLGSSFEAEDAVQETMVRAWRNASGFEGRASLRTWLHRIATNVCFDFLGAKQRRARPMDFGPVAVAPTEPGEKLAENVWLQPIPDALSVAADGDPADVAVARETIRLAFVAALQTLPPRQRAVLILREVLHWKAEEVAELLDSSVASVNSALQRARAAMAERGQRGDAAVQPIDVAQAALVARYVDAFERYDMDALVALLRDDAIMSMPPYAIWLQGHDDIARWHLGPGHECRGSRLVPTSANCSPAFGQYRIDPDGGYYPWALQVLEIDDDRIVGLNSFLDTERLFPMFNLAPHLPPQ